MSLDIGLTAVVETEVVSMNITHNLSNMWDAAGIWEVLYESEGKTAKEVLPVLKSGLQKMLEDPDKFRQFDSSNGWGVYEDAVPWLRDLIHEFEKYPDGVIWKDS